MTNKVIRILFVEDVPADMLMAEEELKKGNVNFVSLRVDTADELILGLAEFKPDVIISDYVLPFFNGLAALKIVLEKEPEIPVIMLTGSINEETAVNCIKQGAADYILKDKLKRLPLAVQEALAQKEVRMARARAEKALKENEKRYKHLFQMMAEGVGYKDTLNLDAAISEKDVVTIIRDLTERKTAEKALQRNDSLLKLMTNSSPLAFFVVDNETDEILYFNKKFCEIWGILNLEERMRSGELRNNDIIPDCCKVIKDVPAFAESCKPLQSPDNTITLEDEIIFTDGRIIRRFSTQIRGSHDECYGRLYIFEDVSDRRNAEKFIKIQHDLVVKLRNINEMSEILTLSLEELITIENVDCGGIYLIDPETGGLRLHVHKGLSSQFIENSTYFGPHEMQTLLVLNGEPTFNLLSNIVPQKNVDAQNDGILGIAVIPIMHENIVFGCVNLASKTSPVFYDRIKNHLESLILQIGFSISRIQSENMLKVTRQNFEMMFDRIDDFLFILNSDGTIIKTNPVVRERLGYSEEELLTMNVLMAHPPERREEAGIIVGEMLEGKKSYCPIPLYTKNGGQIPVETRVVKGKWDNKDVLYGISRDVSERHKAELALKMQGAAFESFALPIIISDINGIITWANSAFGRQNGYTSEEILGKTPGQLVRSGKQDREFYKKLWSTILNGEIWNGELINRKKDGTLYHEEMTITPVLDLEKQISHFIAIKIDVTSRKQIEKAFRESEARWNFAIEGSGDGVWDWNVKTNEVFYSKQWKAMLGYSEEEISNGVSEWDRRLHPEDRDQCIDDLEKHFRGETKIYINEHRVLCKDGTYKWILDRGKLFDWNEDGSPLRMIGTHSDISQRVKLEESLKQQMQKEKELNELKSKFISIASHEFRTPLSSIMASAESMLHYSDRMDPSQVASRLTKITRQVKSLDEIITGVLQLSRLQSGKGQFEPEAFDFVLFCKDIVDEFRSLKEESNEIEFKTTWNSIAVVMDKKLMRQVVSNLISNAIKYSAAKSPVFVQIRQTNEEITLLVKDKGIGIPNEDMTHLFTPFFRGSNTGNLPGTGLGLNIVKESVNLHGGSITVESKVSAGTTFTVSFPTERHLTKE